MLLVVHGSVSPITNCLYIIGCEKILFFFPSVVFSGSNYNLPIFQFLKVTATLEETLQVIRKVWPLSSPVSFCLSLVYLDRFRRFVTFYLGLCHLISIIIL